MTVFLSIIIDFVSKGFNRVLLNSCSLNSFLLLFLLFTLFFVFSLFSLLGCSLLFLLKIVDVLSEVSDSQACSLGVLFVIINVIVELNQFYILFKGPFPETVSVEVKLVALEICEMLVDIIKMLKPSLEFPLFEERFACLDNVPVILKFV